MVISEKNHIFVPKGLIKTQEIMTLVDLDKFIESLMWMWNGPETATFFNDLKLALDKQGLAYKDGKIIKTKRRVSAEAKETGYGEPEDKEKPNGGIVLEDFNEGDGFYKVNLAYLSKEQVEEIENIAKKWNPELKESDDEDERIRKMLIKFFGKGAEYNSSTNGIFDKDILTWLEKQGTSYTKRDVDDAYVEGMAFAKNELEKQKSSWSEDDEKMKDLIISVLEVNHSKGIFKVGLRAIRTEEIVSWLKFLKQRYTWKPSKEQMDAMQMAVSYFGYSWISKEQELLESLYNDLKKLTKG